MDEPEIFKESDHLTKNDPVVERDLKAEAVSNIDVVTTAQQTELPRTSAPSSSINVIVLPANGTTPEPVSVEEKEPMTTAVPASHEDEDVSPDSSLSTQSLKELLPHVHPILPDPDTSPATAPTFHRTSSTPTIEKKSQGVGTPPSPVPLKVDVQEQRTPPTSNKQPPWDWTDELRERELDRRSREIDRRERELERRERELERRLREFEYDKARWTIDLRSAPQWHGAIESLRQRLETSLLAERKRAAERESALEENLMRKVNEILEKDRQMYSAMQMSEKEVKEMMESSVGYLLQGDDDIADRVRFQSLLYLSQERLAMEAGLQPASGSGSLSLAWRLALGPSVITEIRHNKALELLKDKELDESTKKVMESKTAMEYVVEFTSHLRKEGSEMGDHSFAPGRIGRDAYLESVRRQADQGTVDYDALFVLVDFISPK